MTTKLFSRILFLSTLAFSPIIFFCILSFFGLWQIFLSIIFDAIALSEDAKLAITYVLFTRFNNPVMALVVCPFSIYLVRKLNKNELLNPGDSYFDINYSLFWYCSKILGYNKCKLTRIPIYLQFKLVKYDTFKEYIHDSLDIDNTLDFWVKWRNSEVVSNQVNIVLSDTYLIDDLSIPSSNRDFPTVYIERIEKKSGVNSINSKFIAEIKTIIFKLREEYTVLNIYATTNSVHTEKIASQNFKTGGRLPEVNVYIFQADSKKQFQFKGKGYLLS